MIIFLSIFSVVLFLKLMFTLFLNWIYRSVCIVTTQDLFIGRGVYEYSKLSLVKSFLYFWTFKPVYVSKNFQMYNEVIKFYEEVLRNKNESRGSDENQ